MRNKIITLLALFLLSSPSFADSISITVKPARGLSGTTSLTIHDDGMVTVLVYESAMKVSENSVDIHPAERDQLRLETIRAIDDYLNRDSYASLTAYSFTISLAHTIDGVTKNISSKRLNKQAVKVIQKLTTLVPDNALQYAKDEI